MKMWLKSNLKLIVSCEWTLSNEWFKNIVYRVVVDAVGLSRIIGGSVGEIGAFPFLISLRTARNMQWVQVNWDDIMQKVMMKDKISGTFVVDLSWLRDGLDQQVGVKIIICQNCIKTFRSIFSAHCTRGKQPSNVVAVAGEISNSKAGRPIVLSKFVIHQKFDVNTKCVEKLSSFFSDVVFFIIEAKITEEWHLNDQNSDANKVFTECEACETSCRSCEWWNWSGGFWVSFKLTQ